MKKEFVTYKQALALKQLGFDEPCFVSVNSEGKNILFHDDHTLGKNSEILYGIYLPLYQQAFRWIRTKNIDFAIFDKHKDLGKFYGGYIKKESDDFGQSFGSNFKTYEEAENVCLDTLIEILKSYENKTT